MKKLIIFLCVLYASTVYAHPVIWEDGKAWLYNDTKLQENTRFLYSITHYQALGLRSVNIKKTGQHAILVQYNIKVKRWNTLHSQGNIYVSTGAGTLRESADFTGALTLQADWENRRIYTLAAI